MLEAYIKRDIHIQRRRRQALHSEKNSSNLKENRDLYSRRKVPVYSKKKCQMLLQVINSFLCQCVTLFDIYPAKSSPDTPAFSFRGLIS
jgi:hypothetical protein